MLEFAVPLWEIRSTLELDVAELRRRRGEGTIERRRGVLGSQPVFAGTRIRPEAVIGLLEEGWDERRIIDEYPDLRPSDIKAARAYARRAG